MAFAAGALVFPGGRVEPGDFLVAADPALAGNCTGDSDDAAARVAAIRETIEEAGIAVGFAASPEQLGDLRDGLAAGRNFAELLRTIGVQLNLDRLVPFARWLPAFQRVTRRFDTRFYAAVAPNDGEAIADGGESIQVVWATPRDLLAAAERGDHRIIFPTRRNLERVAVYGSFTALRAAVAGLAIDTISPWFEERDGVRWLCIPEGIGYPVTAERIETVQWGSRGALGTWQDLTHHRQRVVGSMLKLDQQPGRRQARAAKPALAVHQRVDAGRQLGAQALARLMSRRPERPIKHPHFDDEQMPPVRVPVRHRPTQAGDAEGRQLVSLDQDQHRHRASRGDRVEVEPEVPVPCARERIALPLT